MENKLSKKELGQFFTKNNVWLNSNVLSFIENRNINTIVDPFAGNGDLLKPFAQKYNIIGYDIDLTLGWQINDSLRGITSMPNSLCLTNPPYMAKTTTKRFKVKNNYQYFEEFQDYNDLYLIALYQCLTSFEYVIAIIPETFISSKYFKKYLYSVSILENNPFVDTEFPTVLCMWDKTKIFNDFKVFNHNTFIDYYSNILSHLPSDTIECLIKFNDVRGQIGLIGIDGGKEGQYIRFCNKEEIKVDEIKNSSRLRTRIYIDLSLNDGQINDFIDKLNVYLNEFRIKTNDILLSPFKGNNSLGRRRRRLDYRTAEKLINRVLINEKFLETLFKF